MTLQIILNITDNVLLQSRFMWQSLLLSAVFGLSYSAEESRRCTKHERGAVLLLCRVALVNTSVSRLGLLLVPPRGSLQHGMNSLCLP